MTINFPDSPTHGQTATLAGKSFTYDSDVSGWNTASVSSVNLSSIPQDILPDADSSRSLGSSTKKWKDLHLSSSTIFLGDSGSISSGAGGEIILPSIKIGTDDNAVKLEADATGKLKTKSIVSGVTQAAEEPGSATVLSDMAGLIALTGMSAGQTALVTSLNKIFMYTGTGWFLIATMTNSSPTAITGVDATYSLATDGTATTVTVASTDPEGFPLTFSHTVTAGSLTNGGGTTATVTQGTGANTNVFTITPSTTEAYAGNFSLTFSVTDGATGAVNAVSAFSLVFTPPLPTSGLLGLYDMNDTNSYSGSGTSWNDVSGNSGPTFTIDTTLTSYINSSSGIGGIPALALETIGQANGSSKVVYYSSSGLTNSAYPYANTVILIFAHRESRFYAGAYGQQTWYFLMSKPGPSYAIFAEQSTNTSLLVGTGNTGTWSGDKGAASSGSKLYIDKVDATTYTQQQVFNALSDTNNKDKYHSIVLTDGLFYGGFSLNEINPNLWNATMAGDLRAMVFYDRALSSSEVTDVHDHFASDYTSSEMVQ